jgi:hypothetical protein
MREHRLNCTMTAGDHITGGIDSDGEVRLETRTNGGSELVYASPAEFRDFARKVLSEAGTDLDSDDDSVTVGDYVEITVYRSYDRSHVGKRGTVTQIDSDGIPYLVDTDTDGEMWAVAVRKTSRAGGTRASYVGEAKRILAGSDPTAADIVRLAEFLASGE